MAVYRAPIRYKTSQSTQGGDNSSLFLLEMGSCPHVTNDCPLPNNVHEIQDHVCVSTTALGLSIKLLNEPTGGMNEAMTNDGEEVTS